MVIVAGFLRGKLLPLDTDRIAGQRKTDDGDAVSAGGATPAMAAVPGLPIPGPGLGGLDLDDLALDGFALDEQPVSELDLDELEPPLPVIPDLPGREGPPGGQTTPVDNQLDDDPEDVAPPDEDRDAVEADDFGGARPTLIPA